MVLGEIPKNKSQKIVVETREYNGYPFTDIRIYHKERDGMWSATTKGVTVAPEKIGELINLLQKAEGEYGQQA